MVVMFVGGVVLMLDGFLQIIKSKMSQLESDAVIFRALSQ